MKDYSKKTKIPPYVNWEVINQCNMGCPYCFLADGNPGGISTLSHSQSISMLEGLSGNGVRMINYAGGEPLLREDLGELIEFGHESGMKTILSTNGILLTDHVIEGLSHSLNWVSLPVDGYDDHSHDSVRKRRGHFQEIVSRMEAIQNSGIGLKINTMVCRSNIGYLDRIAGLLDDYHVKKWKLFQFSARGKAARIQEEYEVSDEEFSGAGESVGEHGFDVIFSFNHLRDNAYFLISPDGTVTVPSGSEYIRIGNIMDGPDGSESGVLDFGKNSENARISYDLEVV
jgi:MoaA/NifB/PqqE/SkfB family radical SAM enzyme